jgi:hypothetical protein
MPLCALRSPLWPRTRASLAPLTPIRQATYYLQPDHRTPPAADPARLLLAQRHFERRDRNGISNGAVEGGEVMRANADLRVPRQTAPFSINPPVWAKEPHDHSEGAVGERGVLGPTLDYPVMYTCLGVMILVMACPSSSAGWWPVRGPVLTSATIVACSEGR